MELTGKRSSKVLLVANYEPDGQESMLRFCILLAEGLRKRKVSVQLVRPQPVFGRFSKGTSPLAKWLGYVDKLILFPVQLKEHLLDPDIIHICDHANAIYVKYLKNIPNLVTCHDLLAVRAGLGEETYCTTSPLGKVLQSLILQGLRQTRVIACISRATYADAERLIGSDNNKLRLVPNAFNYPYRVIDEKETLQRLSKVAGLLPSETYLLHVGSSQPRKNRDGILRIFSKLKDRFSGQMVFAGEFAYACAASRHR